MSKDYAPRRRLYRLKKQTRFRGFSLSNKFSLPYNQTKFYRISRNQVNQEDFSCQHLGIKFIGKANAKENDV